MTVKQPPADYVEEPPYPGSTFENSRYYTMAPPKPVKRDPVSDWEAVATPTRLELFAIGFGGLLFAGGLCGALIALLMRLF